MMFVPRRSRSAAPSLHVQCSIDRTGRQRLDQSDEAAYIALVSNQVPAEGRQQCRRITIKDTSSCKGFPRRREQIEQRIGHAMIRERMFELDQPSVCLQHARDFAQRGCWMGE